MVNWYAVHPTSMNNTNKLVSGDNKGYASQLFEKAMNPGALPGQVRCRQRLNWFPISSVRGSRQGRIVKRGRCVFPKNLSCV